MVLNENEIMTACRYGWRWIYYGYEGEYSQKNLEGPKVNQAVREKREKGWEKKRRKRGQADLERQAKSEPIDHMSQKAGL